MTNMYFSICGLFCIALLVVIFFSKKRVNSVETRIYGLMLISSFIDVLLVLFEVSFGYMELEVLPITFIKILNKIDFIHYIIWPTLMFLYVFYITYKDDKKYREMKKFLFCLDMFFILVEFCLPIDIINEANGAMGVSGVGTNVVYGFSALYFVMIILVLLFNLRKTFTKKYIPFIALFIFMILAMYVRSVSPTLIVIPAIIIYIDLIMFFTIENPDIKMIEKLNVAKEQADRANRAKTDFLSSMSHEIRTPLNAIVGFSECVKQAESLEEAKENADDIISASGTLLEIVNGVLDISKIEAGKIEIHNSCYNSKELFDGIVKLIKGRLGDKPLDFRVSIAEDIPETLYGDHSNLKKIIINLLTNAVKYTDKGYFSFKVSCVKTDDICRLMISVEDSGRGIKPEHIDKLFTKFQRLDEDKNTTIEGTGLGLAITKQLIELMGGKIVVQSTFGEGSKFSVAIDQKITNEKVERAEEVNEVIDLSDKKILIVDDNTLNLKVASKILAKYKPIIDTAESGMECLDKINNGNKYDLILMDDMMPRMNGGETLLRLKQIPNFDIKVIALTANALTGMEEKYLNQGFDGYLAKPIEKDKLHQVLSKFLGGEKIQEEKKVEEPVVDQKVEYVKETVLPIKNMTDNSTFDLTNKNILIVDDNKLNIKVASTFLKKYNPNIESVLSGEECLEKIKSGITYDLIFMDDMMPNMSGVETFHELHNLDGFNIPVVALTANALEGMKEQYLNEGFDDYLAKPIDKQELDRILKKIFNQCSYKEEPTNETNATSIENAYKEKIETPTQFSSVYVNKEETNKGNVEYLKNNGIDVEHGLELLGDMEMYNETLNDFYNNINNRITKIKELKEKQDMVNYAIEVHALKSDSKYLGFMTLADFSYKHEMASKANNIEFVNINFEELMEEANRIINFVKEYLGK